MVAAFTALVEEDQICHLNTSRIRFMSDCTPTHPCIVKTASSCLVAVLVLTGKPSQLVQIPQASAAHKESLLSLQRALWLSHVFSSHNLICQFQTSPPLLSPILSCKVRFSGQEFPEDPVSL